MRYGKLAQFKTLVVHLNVVEKTIKNIYIN